MVATAVDDLVDLATAGRRLGVDRRLVNVLVLEGRLPAHRLGQRWYVTAEALEEFARHYTRPSRGRERLQPEMARPVVEAVADHPGATVGELAELVGRPKRTVLGWVQMLDEEGLVERRRGRGSRDPDHCFLTEDGRAFCEGGQGAVADDGRSP
jgi:excisionase family DNA binding protein